MTYHEKVTIFRYRHFFVTNWGSQVTFMTQPEKLIIFRYRHFSSPTGEEGGVPTDLLDVIFLPPKLWSQNPFYKYQVGLSLHVLVSNTHISCQSFEEFASSVILKWLLHLSYISCAHPIIYRSYFDPGFVFIFAFAFVKDEGRLLQDCLQWCRIWFRICLDICVSIFIYDCKRRIRPTCSWSRFSSGFVLFFPCRIFTRRIWRLPIICSWSGFW